MIVRYTSHYSSINAPLAPHSSALKQAINIDDERQVPGVRGSCDIILRRLHVSSTLARCDGVEGRRRASIIGT